MVRPSAIVFGAAAPAPMYYTASQTAPATPALHRDWAFPTNVGHAGLVESGARPFRAQMGYINATSENRGESIELRWLPKDAAKDNATSDDIFRNLGPSSPYRPAFDLFPETIPYQSIPPKCDIEQVHLIYRHGARYPNYESKAGPWKFGIRIANAKASQQFHATGDLSFLHDWEYSLGIAKLVNQGAQDMFVAGSHAYYQYGALLEKATHKPIIRTTSQSRMLDSARYWTLGFFGWDAPKKVHLEVLTEAKHMNSTLSPKYACKNSRKNRFKMGRQASSEWNKIFLPSVVQRLQPMLKGINLTNEDVMGMMSACAYETVGLGYSDFCRVFTKAEWENFEYSMDLEFQGDHGFMSPTGKAQGIGWVTELKHRLLHKPFAGPWSSQNATVNTNLTYFPVDQPLYVDFTHDTVLTGILTALNMSQFSEFLDPKQTNFHRKYRASHVTPFAARLILEVIACNDEKWIRMKLNEAIIPLNQDQGCPSRTDGLCPWSGFIQHLEKAYDESMYDLSCFGKNGTDFIVDGPVRQGVPSMILK